VQAKTIAVAFSYDLDPIPASILKDVNQLFYPC